MGWGRRLLQRRAGRTRAVPGDAALAARRWGCVVEVTDGDRLVRAWAYGHDPVRLTGELGALVTMRLARAGAGASLDRPRPGIVAVSQVAPARAVLDELAVRTDLRWSRASIGLPGR
jgi:hypothetical protein